MSLWSSFLAFVYSVEPMQFLQMVINGFFNGTGTGIGSYFAVKYAITHGEKVKHKIIKTFKKKKKGG